MDQTEGDSVDIGQMGFWSPRRFPDDQVDELQNPRQQALPIPWRMLRASEEFDEHDFAHPAELELARILTFYRIRWAYEPTTFPLSFGPDGRPSEMFTPDFYLPDHKLYIELTTMRQRLVTRKNRKLRRLRELYPSVQIKLLYRRDYDRLVDAYGLAGTRESDSQVERILFSADDIHGRINDLAVDVAASLASRESDPAKPTDTNPEPPLLLMAVDRGSAVFSGHFARSLREHGVEIEQDHVILTRHHAPTGERKVRIGRAPETDVEGRHILIVADVVSTGLSLAYLIHWLTQKGARHVEICTMFDRRGARLIEVPVRFTAFEAPNELVVGFGLNLRRRFRDLPYIASVTSASRSEGRRRLKPVESDAG